MKASEKFLLYFFIISSSFTPSESLNFSIKYSDKSPLNGTEDDITKEHGNFEYVIENKKAIIMKCDRNAKGRIELPEKIEGHTVTGIGNHAFFNCTGVEEIILPDKIKYIGTSAFAYCEKLEVLYLPKSVEEIGINICEGCTSFKTVRYAGKETEWNSINLMTPNVVLENAEMIYSSKAVDSDGNVLNNGAIKSDTILQKISEAKTLILLLIFMLIIGIIAFVSIYTKNKKNYKN